VRDVLSDADTRASLADGGVTAGYNHGFFMASADGDFLLKIGGHIQARYIADHRNGPHPVPVGFDTEDNGFQIRCSKYDFNGHVSGPQLTFRLVLAPSRDTGIVETEDAWLMYEITDGLQIQFGKFKDYFAREQINSSKRMLAVDRSLPISVLVGGDGFVEGLAMIWTRDRLRIAGSINDGVNSGLASGGSPGFLNGGNDFLNDASDIAGTVRAEYLLAGSWRDYEDFSSWSDESTSIIVGGALHYELAESGDRQSHGTTSVTGPFDAFYQWTADAGWKSSGLGLYASVIGMHMDLTDTNTVAQGALDIYAATFQAAYMLIPDKFEPFVRYEWMSVDRAIATSDVNLVTAGANYYFRKHEAKFTLDATYFFNPATVPNTLGGLGMTGSGFQNDLPGHAGQVSIRAQMQLLF
jgi:hypothetical protein